MKTFAKIIAILFVFAPAASWAVLGKRLNDPNVVLILTFLTLVGCFSFVVCLMALQSQTKAEEEVKERTRLSNSMRVEWNGDRVELVEEK